MANIVLFIYYLLMFLFWSFFLITLSNEDKNLPFAELFEKVQLPRKYDMLLRAGILLGLLAMILSFHPQAAGISYGMLGGMAIASTTAVIRYYLNNRLKIKC